MFPDIIKILWHIKLTNLTAEKEPNTVRSTGSGRMAYINWQLQAGGSGAGKGPRRFIKALLW